MYGIMRYGFRGVTGVTRLGPVTPKVELCPYKRYIQFIKQIIKPTSSSKPEYVSTMLT